MLPGLGWILGGKNQGRIYWGGGYGWCVEYNGNWCSVDANGEVACSKQRPEGKLKDCSDTGWFAPQVLLEYARLITDMEAASHYGGAKWPTTLLDTAHKIDMLTEVLENFMDHKYEREQSRRLSQWAKGTLKRGNNILRNWASGTVFTFQHAGKEFALAIGDYSYFSNYNEGQQHQIPNGTGNQYYSDCSGIYFAQYGRKIRMELETSEDCSLEQFKESLSKAIELHKPTRFSDLHQVSKDLINQHEHDFGKSFCRAAVCEHWKWQFGDPGKGGQWKGSFLKTFQTWVSKESHYMADISALQEKEISLKNLISQKRDTIRDLEVKMRNQDQENGHLREQMSQYRVSLATVSSGLGTLNIADEAQFPSANQALQNYDKLAEKLMDIYDEAVYNEESGQASKILQLEFSQEMAAILEHMWETMCSRYTQLLKDLSGCADPTTLSQGSINRCDMHCRQHWENLFVPMFSEMMSSLPQQKSVHVIHPGKEDVLKRLWRSIILLFLQRPALAVLPSRNTTEVEFDPEKYSVHNDGSKVKKQQAVVEVLPPIYCVLDMMKAIMLGFEGCNYQNKKFLIKGIVDLVGME